MSGPTCYVLGCGRDAADAVLIGGVSRPACEEHARRHHP